MCVCTHGVCWEGLTVHEQNRRVDFPLATLIRDETFELKQEKRKPHTPCV